MCLLLVPPLQPGTITRVKMLNLRCHQMVQLHLGARVNFITGNNGSGKSTVLTAIVLALGGDVKRFQGAKSGGAEQKGSIIRTGQVTGEVCEHVLLALLECDAVPRVISMECMRKCGDRRLMH